MTHIKIKELKIEILQFFKKLTQVSLYLYTFLHPTFLDPSQSDEAPQNELNQTEDEKDDSNTELRQHTGETPRFDLMNKRPAKNQVLPLNTTKQEKLPANKEPEVAMTFRDSKDHKESEKEESENNDFQFDIQDNSMKQCQHCLKRLGRLISSNFLTNIKQLSYFNNL